MIFVSVGTQDRPFNRLIEGVDRMAESVDEKILAQIGNATCIPDKIDFFRYCKYDEMLSHIKSASIVISQAGFGIIGNSINMNKPMILVPREIELGEAIDKQYELAEYLAGGNESIICVRDVGLLHDAVKSLRNVPVRYNYKTVIPELIDNFISRVFPEGA